MGAPSSTAVCSVGLGHLEMGHVVVPRRPDDAFAGVCPFHGDCLEGMASGPAVAARFGRRAEGLDGTEREVAVAIVAWDLAAGMSSIVYALAPERIIVGGGLGSMPGLAPAIRTELVARLGGYPGLPEHADDRVRRAGRPGLGGMAGPLGASPSPSAPWPLEAGPTAGPLGSPDHRRAVLAAEVG